MATNHAHWTAPKMTPERITRNYHFIFIKYGYILLLLFYIVSKLGLHGIYNENSFHKFQTFIRVTIICNHS